MIDFKRNLSLGEDSNYVHNYFNPEKFMKNFIPVAKKEEEELCYKSLLCCIESVFFFQKQNHFLF